MRGWNLVACAVFLGLIQVFPAVGQDASFSGVITQDDAEIRAGAGVSYYIVGRLKKGTPVEVEDKIFEWYKVKPPKGVYSYISKAFVDAGGDGSTGVVNKDRARVNAGSINGPGESYRRQMNLLKDDVVQIIGEEGGFYKIVPPAGTSVFVLTDAVVKQDAPNAPSVNKPKPKPAAVESAPSAPPAPAPAKPIVQVDPAPAKPASPDRDKPKYTLPSDATISNNVTTPKPTAPTVAEATPAPKPAKPAPKPTAGTATATATATAEKPTQVPWDATETETTAAEAVEEAIAAATPATTVSTPTPAPAPTQATSMEPTSAVQTPPTPPVTTVAPAQASAELQQLEEKFAEAMKLPVQKRPNAELLEAYQIVYRQPNLSIIEKRTAYARMAQLKRDIGLAKALMKIDSATSTASTQQPTMAVQFEGDRAVIVDASETEGAVVIGESIDTTPTPAPAATVSPAPTHSGSTYNAMGRLQASVVYNGETLPRLYRVVSTIDGRTVIYIKPTDSIDPAAHLGRVVGVMGETVYDPSLRLKLMTPDRIDAVQTSN